jgi:hypothetical protein
MIESKIPYWLASSVAIGYICLRGSFVFHAPFKNLINPPTTTQAPTILNSTTVVIPITVNISIVNPPYRRKFRGDKYTRAALAFRISYIRKLIGIVS